MTLGTTRDRDQALVGDALRAEAGMKAVMQRRYGPPEVLESTDVGRPVVGAATCSSGWAQPRSIPATTSS